MKAEGSIVAGMTMRIVQEGIAARPLLSGPVIAAALAAKRNGLSPRLLLAVPVDMSADDWAILRKIDPDLSLIRRLPLPALRLQISHVVGDGLGRIVGNPISWTAPAPRMSIERLLLANADPRWHLETLDRLSAEFVAVDIHREWLRSRLDEISVLIQRAHLVTINACDLEVLKVAVHATLQSKHCVLVKRGAEGVTLHYANESRDLPPPKVDSVGTDVCAGDVLLGAFSSVIPIDSPMNLPSLCAAYEQASSTVALLLRAPSVQAFIEGAIHALDG